MKCLAVFLVLIGLSLAMPVGEQLSLSNLLYIICYILGTHTCSYYITASIFTHAERTNQLSKAEAILDLCCKYPSLRPLLCSSSFICSTRNPTRQTTIIAKTEKISPPTQISPFVKVQDLSGLLSSVPSIRRLATGLISNLANYVNQTKTDVTLADILNTLRKGSKNFDSLLEKLMPSVLQRIKDFMAGSLESEKSVPNEMSTTITTSTPPTTRLPIATGPPPTKTPPLIINNILNNLPAAIRRKLADLVRGIINKGSPPQSQGIAGHTIPLSSYAGLSRCFSQGLMEEDLMRCLTFNRANKLTSYTQEAIYETAPSVVEDKQDIAKTQAEEELLEELEEALNN